MFFFHFMQAYWLSYIHKQLVGQNVLNVATDARKTNAFWYWTSTSSSEEVRVYAHCTQIR